MKNARAHKPNDALERARGFFFSAFIFVLVN
jgi:hypothetical protein